MEVKSGVSWCRAVLAPYLEAVYRKPTLDSDQTQKSLLQRKGGRLDKLQPIIGL